MSKEILNEFSAEELQNALARKGDDYFIAKKHFLPDLPERDVDIIFHDTALSLDWAGACKGNTYKDTEFCSHSKVPFEPEAIEWWCYLPEKTIRVIKKQTLEWIVDGASPVYYRTARKRDYHFNIKGSMFTENFILNWSKANENNPGQEYFDEIDDAKERALEILNTNEKPNQR